MKTLLMKTAYLRKGNQNGKKYGFFYGLPSVFAANFVREKAAERLGIPAEADVVLATWKVPIFNTHVFN